MVQMTQTPPPRALRWALFGAAVSANLIGMYARLSLASSSPRDDEEPHEPHTGDRLRCAVTSAVRAGARAVSGVPHLDKVGHAASFAVVAATGRWAGLPAGALTSTLAINAVASEVVQERYIEGRSGDAGDVIADVAGIGVGLWVSRWPRGWATSRI